MTTTLTDRQVVALTAAVEKGGAWYARVSKTGGAWHRMCLALAARGLLKDDAPFAATDAGCAALADAKERKFQAAYRRGEAWACHEMLKCRGMDPFAPAKLASDLGRRA